MDTSLSLAFWDTPTFIIVDRTCSRVILINTVKYQPVTQDHAHDTGTYIITLQSPVITREIQTDPRQHISQLISLANYNSKKKNTRQ